MTPSILPVVAAGPLARPLQPPAPARLTAEEVRAQHDGLGALLVLLPELALTPAQKGALSALRFLEAPGVVLSVVAGLRRTPALFPEEAPLAEILAARLDRAIALRSLERLLLEAARRAGELALCDEAATIEDATAIVQRAKAAATERGGRRRLDQLRGALRVLDRRIAASTKGRRAQLARDARR